MGHLIQGKKFKNLTAIFPAMMLNQSDIRLSNPTQLTVLLYRFSKSSMIVDETPSILSNSQTDFQFTELKAVHMLSRMVARILALSAGSSCNLCWVARHEDPEIRDALIIGRQLVLANSRLFC